MTPLDPAAVRQAFQLIRQKSHPSVHELAYTLEHRLLLDESMLALQARVDDVCERIMDGTLGEPDNVVPFRGYSVKVGGA